MNKNVTETLSKLVLLDRQEQELEAGLRAIRQRATKAGREGRLGDWEAAWEWYLKYQRTLWSLQDDVMKNNRRLWRLRD